MEYNEHLADWQFHFELADQLVREAQEEGRDLTVDEEKKFKSAITTANGAARRFNRLYPAKPRIPLYGEGEYQLLRDYLSDMKDESPPQRVTAPQDPRGGMAYKSVTPQFGATDMRSLFGIPSNHQLDRRGFDGFGDFLRAVALSRKQHDNRLALRTMNTQDGPSGGFMIPAYWAIPMLDEIVQNSDILPYCTILPMTGLGLNVPALDDDDHSSSRAGIVAGWVAEASVLSAQDIVMRNIELRAKKLAILIKVSNEWLFGAPGGEELIRQVMISEARWMLERSIVKGNGAVGGLGFMNAGCLLTTSKEVGQAAGTLTWTNVVDMHEKLSPSANKAARWYFSPSLKSELFGLTIPVGTAGNSVWQGSTLNAAGPLNLLGYPVIFSEHMEVAGALGDVLLCAPKAMLVGMAMDIRVDVDSSIYFDQDCTAFRLTMLVDHAPKRNTAVTLSDGSTVVSDATVLEAR